MFETPITPSITTEALLDARKKFEAEKLTRRAALKKFGITIGMAVFGMFAADDLARMVIKKMEETEATRQIAETVAHEFKNAGIAFADSSTTCGSDCSTCVQNIRTNYVNACKSTYMFPFACLQQANTCITNCNATCPDVNATVSDLAKMTACFDSCISDKGYPVAAY